MSELKKRTKQDTFNPVKEDTAGIQAKRAIWSSKSLDLAYEGLKQGRKLVANPFYENNTKLLKGDLVFDRTPDEIQEWLRCKNDIIYFVEKYCKLMTPEGIRNVKLRDYQQNYLKHLMDHRLSIYLACRQCGKCNLLITNILIKINWEIFKKSYASYDDKLKKYFDRLYYNKEKDCYELPLFEIYNLYDKSFKWKIQYLLYKIVYKYEQREKRKETKKRSTT